MFIQDRIYGKVEIDNPLIAELINSRPLQRLKDISQDGAAHLIYPSVYATRFEHCFGVWYLSYRFNRPIDEQVACLLHDVPHTAFSHVIDLVMKDDRQEYHERFLQEVVLNSEIPEICTKYGVNINRVLETKNYYLLENHTPELSFDRWDYFMRDGHIIGIFPLEAIAQTIGSAKLKGNQLYFQDLQFAGSLCLASINTSELLYASHNPTAFAAWSILASAIRVGLDTGVLTQADLFATDSVVLAKMKSSDNKAINESLQRLRPSTEFIFSDDSEAEFSGQGKARYIDPLVDRGGKLVPVSKLIPGLSQRIESFKAQCRHISVKSKSGSNKSQ